MTSIGQSAFNRCSGLTSVTIPASVTSIGDYVFNDCSNLATITVETSNTVYNSRNGCNAIIETSSNKLIAGCKNTTIPASVTSIGNYAFYGCSGLTSITIPASVTSIAYSAFFGCSGLATVTVYAPSCTLGFNAFSACGNLKNIYVFSDLVDDYKAAWSAYESKIKGMVGGYCGTTDHKEDVVWRYDNGTLTISGTGEMADYGYSSQPWNTNTEYIKTVLIENGVTSIGECAFNDCEKLTTVSIPASVTSIGNYAFGYCSNLTSIEIPASVTTIGEEAFNNTALTSIEIPASVTSIGNGAFNSCSNLESVKLNSNPTIGENAFYGIKEGATVTMNLAAAEVGGAHWTTFYNNYGNFQADENTEVYKGVVSGSELVLTAISDKIVNAGNAVILKSTGNPVPVMTLTTTNSSDDFTDNVLKGLSVRTLASEVKTNYSANTIYVMGNTAKNGFGFHKYTGEYMPANKAFLALGSGSSAPLRMVIDDEEETTGIASMADGIDNMSDVWYTLDGRKLNGKPTTKGLYIVNGKKVMIK